MRAVCWQGNNKVGVETVPDPKILNSRDAIVKITSTAICGSDLHLYAGLIPTVQKGDIYSHLLGGYAGGQAEYARVPFADVGLLKIPDGLTDEQVIFLTDIFPTGYMAAENCQIQRGDTVAIWGCGPIGQFAIRSALMLGAERVIAIDRIPERLLMAQAGGAETLNYEEVEVGEALKEMTGGRGPDAVMDAVGMEAHGQGLEGLYDKAMQAVKLELDRSNVLRQVIVACRKGGTVSLPGDYIGLVDKVPMGAFMNKGLTMKSGQTHIHKYLRPLLDRIQKGDIDPTFIITHILPLEQAAHGYKIFQQKQDSCIKIVLKPGLTAA